MLNLFSSLLKKNKPVVSIVIPVYNRPFLLARALDSLTKQVFKDWEAVIIDDGSTDNTATIANEYAKTDKRFKLFRFNSK